MKSKRLSLRKKRGIVNAILSIIVLLVLIAHLLRADYHSVFICILTLMLFDIPFWAEKALKITLPKELEIIILSFIFAAEILGEIGSFYTYIPWWDTMLHTINGFLMAAIGFALIDLLNNSPKFHITLSPTFVAVVAFCFSMTIGVLWEFFEFSMDMIFHTDMQKDFIVSSIYTVTFNPDGLNSVYEIPEITETVLLYNGEEIYRFNGYLDIGIIDTMKDLLVNFVGAVVFSTIGYFYILGRNKGVFASKFIPQYHADEPSNDKKEETTEAIAEPLKTEEEKTEITK